MVELCVIWPWVGGILQKWGYEGALKRKRPLFGTWKVTSFREVAIVGRMVGYVQRKSSEESFEERKVVDFYSFHGVVGHSTPDDLVWDSLCDKEPWGIKPLMGS